MAGDWAGVEIVRLPPSEWRAYRDLRLRAVGEEPAAFGTSHEELVGRPESYWRGRLEEAWEGATSWLLFARRGGKGAAGGARSDEGALIGMVGAFLNRHVPDPDDADVISMYVAPEARGRGVGAQLLQAVLDALRETGRVKRVSLYVNSVQARAVRLYESAGFSVVGHARGRLADGHEHDLLHMGRSLEGAA